MRKGWKYFFCTSITILVLAGFAAYQLKVDSSIAGGLWQLVKGNHARYSNMTIMIPRNWIALHQNARLMLFGVAHRNTSTVFLQATPSKMWQEHRFKWVEYEQAKYKSEGYDPIIAPPMPSLGQPTTCVAAASHAKKQPMSIECVLDDGNLVVLATYMGTIEDIPKFTSMLNSLQLAPTGSGE